MSNLRKSSIENVITNATFEQAQYIIAELNKKFGPALNNPVVKSSNKVGRCSISITNGDDTPMAFSNYVRRGTVSKSVVELLLAKENWDMQSIINFFRSIDIKINANSNSNEKVHIMFSDTLHYHLHPEGINSKICVISFNTTFGGTEYIKIRRLDA